MNWHPNCKFGGARRDRARTWTVGKPRTGPEVAHGIILEDGGVHGTLLTSVANSSEAQTKVPASSPASRPGGTDGQRRPGSLLRLVQKHQHDAIPALRQALRQGRSPRVRVEAAQLIGMLRAREGLPDLRRVERIDPSPAVREAAREVLLKMTDVAAHDQERTRREQARASKQLEQRRALVISQGKAFSSWSVGLSVGFGGICVADHLFSDRVCGLGPLVRLHGSAGAPESKHALQSPPH